MSQFDRSLKVIQAAEVALSGLEKKQTDQIHLAIDRSIRVLNARLRKLMAEDKGANLFAKDRAVLLARDLRDTLNVLDPGSKQTQALLSSLEKTLAKAEQTGLEAAKDSYLEKGFGAQSTANISIEVTKAVAQSAYDMLLSHGQQFANNASVAIQQGMMLGYGPSKTAQMIVALGGVTKSRAETIVRTEAMRASVDAAKRQYATDGIEQVIWIATQDKRTCPRCAERAGKIMDMDKTVVPIHPNDRCYIIAYKKSWDEAGLVDHEWLNSHHADASKKAGIEPSLESKSLPAKTFPADPPQPKPPIEKLSKKELALIADDEIATNNHGNRAERIRAAYSQISQGEAQALAHYIGDEFEDINRSYWDKNFRKEDPEVYARSKALAKGAELAMTKLPSITAKSLKEASEFDHPDAKSLAKDGLLTHNMKLDETTLKAFLKNKGAGDTMLAGKLMSTGWGDNGEENFARNSNLEIRVKPRLDGLGKGKLVDQFKNEAYENEVLYLPDTRFKIGKIEIKKGSAEVAELQQQPKYTQEYVNFKQVQSSLSGAAAAKGSAAPDKYSIFSPGVWSDLESQFKLPTFPKNKAEIEAYLAIIDKKIKAENKKTVQESVKVVITAAVPDKTILFVEEI